jgi:nesprin-1
VAFLTLTESKLKNWTVKYGPEEKVQQIMNQYRTFVSKNKIFQEFQKAYVEFVQVCDEYKKDGDISEWLDMPHVCSYVCYQDL